MKITNIVAVGKKPVFDISVDEVEHYVLENGVVSHNSGLIYSANQAFIIGKSQEKDGTDLIGYNFTINIEKSRFVREKSKLPFTVTYEDGIMKYSGLLDIALSSGHVMKPSNGWYSRVNTETGEVEEKKFRIKDTHTPEFWNKILKDPTFNDYIKSRYQLGAVQMVGDAEIAEEFEQITDASIEESIPESTDE